jgi:hypothetical protein
MASKFFCFWQFFLNGRPADQFHPKSLLTIGYAFRLLAKVTVAIQGCEAAPEAGAVSLRKTPPRPLADIRIFPSHFAIRPELAVSSSR